MSCCIYFYQFALKRGYFHLLLMLLLALFDNGERFAFTEKIVEK